MKTPNFIKRFISNTKGSLINKVSDIAGVLIVIAVIIPVALAIYFAANTTGWDANIITMWDMIPYVAIVGLLLAIIFYAISRGKK